MGLVRDQSRRKEAKDFLHLRLTYAEIRWMDDGVGWMDGWM